MLRFALAALALAAVLPMTHPSLANSLPAAASDYVQDAAAPEQPVPSAAAWSPSSDATAPVGFGWG
jgi:hypothetical protein